MSSGSGAVYGRCCLFLRALLALVAWVVAATMPLRAQPRPGDVVGGFSAAVPEGNAIFATAVRADGGMYIGGSFTSIGGVPRTNIALLKPDGSLDLSFDPGFGTEQPVLALAMQGDKLLIAGSFYGYNNITSFNLARALPDGRPDPEFAGTNLIDFVSSSISALHVLPNGQFYIGGSFPPQAAVGRRNIARLNANGTVDPGFNATAVLDRTVQALATLPDGRLVFGGIRLGRLLPSGAPDTTFGGSGILTNYNAVFGLALQPDGRLVCAGSFGTVDGVALNGLARLNADGTRDTTFSTPGGANGRIGTLHRLADGTLLIGGEFSRVGGHERRALARLLPDGALDLTFRCDLGTTVFSDSILYATIRAFSPAGAGRMVGGGIFASANGTPRSGVMQFELGGSANRPPWVLGSDATLPVSESDDLRLVIRTDGRPAPSLRWFQGNTLLGGSTNDTLVVSNVTAAAAGEYRVVAQNTQGSVTQLVARVQVNALTNLPGRVNAAFHPGSGPGPRSEVGMESFLYSVALQPDGGVVVGGAFSNFNGRTSRGVARLTPHGQPDPAFNIGSGPAGASPTSVIEIRQVEPAGGGKLLVAGSHASFAGFAAPALTRLHADGSVDTGFRLQGFSSLANVQRLKQQADDRWLLLGQFQATNPVPLSGLARILPDGTLDPSFRPLGTETNLVFAPALLDLDLFADQRVLIGGFFSAIQGQPRSAVAVLRPDGSLDPAFAPSSSLTLARVVAAQADGKVLVGGNFEATPSLPRSFLARLNANGSFDDSFQAAPEITNTVQRLVVLPNQRILVGVGGLFGQGVPNCGVFRLLPDGRLDPDFGGPVWTDNGVLGLTVDPAGSLWVAGGFREIRGIARNGVARLWHEPDPAAAGPALALRLLGNAAEVSFASSLGRTYQLEYRGAVNTGAWMAGPSVAGTGNPLVLRDEPLTGGNRFYRVRVTP